MIVSELEARKRQCVQCATVDRPASELACIGSGCMGWRPVGEGRGYCGMAGTPIQIVASTMTQAALASMGIGAAVSSQFGPEDSGGRGGLN